MKRLADRDGENARPAPDQSGMKPPSPARVALPLRKKLFFAAICLGIFFAAAELMLRLAGFDPLRVDPEQPNIQEYFWVKDSRLGFRNRADGDYVYEWIATRPRVTTDSHGYRNGGGWSNTGSGPIVLFVGDSTTFCAEVSDEETTSASAARLLQEQGLNIRPLNAGCRGYNTLQSLLALEDALDRYGDIRVAVYSYCVNDYFENLNPAVYAPAYAPAIWPHKGTDDWDIIAPTDMPQVDGQPLVPARPARGWRRQTTDWVRRHSALVNHGLFGLRTLVGEESSGGPRESLPNGSLVGTHGAAREQQMEWARQNAADQGFEFLLRRMQTTCRRRGVSLLVAEVPTQDSVAGWLADRCREAEVDWVDTSQAFPGDPRQYLARKVDRQYDPHFNALGARVFAQALAPSMAKALAAQPGTSGALPNAEEAAP